MARCGKIWVIRELGINADGTSERKYIKPHSDFESGRNHARNLSRKFNCTATVEVVIYNFSGIRSSIFETYTNGIIVCDSDGIYEQDENGEPVFISGRDLFKSTPNSEN